MEAEAVDTRVCVDANVLNKLIGLAGELILAREQYRAVCGRPPAAATAPVAAAPPVDPLAERTTLVLFRTPDEGRMAIPLAEVDRIEEFDAAALLVEGERRLAPFRGGLLPLVELSAVLPERRARPRHDAGVAGGGDRVQVIVLASERGSVGLVVERLLDVFTERLVLEQPGSRLGARSSVLLRDRVTELVDVDAILQSIDPASPERRVAPAHAARQS